MINLKEYQFPEVSTVHTVFPTFNTIPELLKEAEERGFLYGQTLYNKLFFDLFYSGRELVKNYITAE